MNDFIVGFKHAFTGFGLIKEPKMKRFVLIPFSINILLFSIGLVYAYVQFDNFLTVMPTWIPDELGLPSWLSWIDSAYQAIIDWFGWLKWVLITMFLGTYLVIVFYTFTIVANLISSPFNGFFAAAIERHLVHKEQQKNGMQTALNTSQTTNTEETSIKLDHVERPIAEEVKVAVIGEARKLLYMAKWLVPMLCLMLVLFFLPLGQSLIPVMWFLFGAWMLSIEYSDYPLGNYGLTFKEEKILMQENRLLAMGFGSAIMLMTMIPIVNFFAVPVGVAGATNLFHNKLRTQALALKKA